MLGRWKINHVEYPDTFKLLYPLFAEKVFGLDGWRSKEIMPFSYLFIAIFQSSKMKLVWVCSDSAVSLWENLWCRKSSEFKKWVNQFGMKIVGTKKFWGL